MTKQTKQVLYNPDLSNKIHSYLPISSFSQDFFNKSKGNIEVLNETEIFLFEIISKVAKKDFQKITNIIINVLFSQHYITLSNNDNSVYYKVHFTEPIHFPILIDSLYNIFNNVKIFTYISNVRFTVSFKKLFSKTVLKNMMIMFYQLDEDENMTKLTIIDERKTKSR